MKGMSMEKIPKVYEFLNKELIRNSMDEENQVHKDIKLLFANQRDKISNEKLKRIIEDLEEKAETELDKDYLEYMYQSDVETYFFPENSIRPSMETIDSIRTKRMVKNVEKIEARIHDPYEEILITSNVLLTLPKNIADLSFDLKDKIDMNEEQQTWYDHPIPLDIADCSNEIIYGLENLSKSLKMETYKSAYILLSVSTTHESLNEIAVQYIQDKINQTNIDNLIIYAMTEEHCNSIVDIMDLGNNALKETFGVAGKYGRHYSFLKAIAPLFRDCIDNNIKGTFKIDLDQVFPQEKIKETTGMYAFDFFRSKKWGAVGYDQKNRKVHLGMIAGGLVNDTDIDKDLVWPDLKKPNDTLTLEQYIFNSTRPQYTSTVAEICKVYNNDDECMIRYHVTGGTNGILLESLEKFRPFTPSFVTRAEDQAFILSVYNKEVGGEFLRYLHLDRFMMRHDKESFLTENLKKSEISKSVGDFERILIFSHYAFDILNIGEALKEDLYPFTSAFIIKRPHLTVLLRMIMRLLMLDQVDGTEFLDSFAPRVGKLIKQIENGELIRTFEKEKGAYNHYYDAIHNKLTDEQIDQINGVFESSKIRLSVKEKK